MPVKVVDASALIAVLFEETEADAISDLIDGVGLVAPPILPFELANAVVTKARRQPDRKAAFIAAFSLRHRLAVEEMAVDHDGVAALALATGLTAYDASYLWLSRILGAELVTLDRQLAKAASAPT
jgi:predicted nucleic acid-binding protein